MVSSKMLLAALVSNCQPIHFTCFYECVDLQETTYPAMSQHLTLITFPTEVLLHIFRYLDILDLGNLRKTCQRFRVIIEESNVLYRGKDNSLVITHGYNELIHKRSNRELSTYQKHRISYNWKNGAAVQTALLAKREKFMPWMHLDRDVIWISRGSLLYAYERTANDIVNTRKPVFVLSPRNKHDICRYVIKNGYILGGQMYGSMFLWSLDKGEYIFDRSSCHQSDIDDVDMFEDLIVSGSRDNTVKVWNHKLKENSIFFLTERIWSVALSKKDLLAVGTTGGQANPISVFDLNRLQIIASMSSVSRLYGAGVKQIKWESPQVLWTCGYDCCVRKWDMRIQRAVQELSDPFMSAIYCFESDFNYSLLAGCQSDGRVVLWDIRKTLPQQLYFMETCKGRWTSPVYSLVYDPCYLFVATASHLNVLDFTTEHAPCKNYRPCL